MKLYVAKVSFSCFSMHGEILKEKERSGTVEGKTIPELIQKLVRGYSCVGVNDVEKAILNGNDLEILFEGDWLRRRKNKDTNPERLVNWKMHIDLFECEQTPLSAQALKDWRKK